MSYIECKLSIPPKVTINDRVVIGLCDLSGEKYILFSIQQHDTEKFLAIFCPNTFFPTPLLHDFTAEILERVKDSPRFKVEKLRIECNEYVKAKIIFQDGSLQELRVEDALALAGRNGWTIEIQESLLRENKGEIKPYKNQILLEEMEERTKSLPNDFEICSTAYCGWGKIGSENN